MTASCLFCRIASGEIPSRKAYEDDEVIAFHDINPAAPVHLLLVPKMHVDSLITTGPEHEALLGKLITLAPRLAKEHGARLVIINRDPTPLDSIAAATLRGSIGEVLTKIAAAID